MKNTLFLLLIISFPIFSQTNENNSFYTFKQQSIQGIKEGDFLNQEFAIDDIKTKKSTGMAIIYSLLLPGMGELYADSYNSGIYFTIADGVLWGTFIGMNVYGNWQKDRYIEYAQVNADITTEYKDDNYYATIGSYSDMETYNDLKALERNYDQMYNSEVYYWKWNTSEDRKSYRTMWISSEQTFNNVRFVVGALILNRVISAINAVRLVSKYNNKLNEEVGWDVSLGVNANQYLPTTTLTLNFQKNF
jgi:hypothetical protein